MTTHAAKRSLTFISHASSDAECAKTICTLLEARGVACWIAPRDISAGAEYQTEILRALQDADRLIVLLSAASNASPFVRNEVERAFSKKKAIYPIRLDDAPPAPELQFFLSGFQSLDFRRGNKAALDPFVDALFAADAPRSAGGAVSLVAPPSRRTLALCGVLLLAIAAVLLAVYAAPAARHGLGNLIVRLRVLNPIVPLIVLLALPIAWVLWRMWSVRRIATTGADAHEHSLTASFGDLVRHLNVASLNDIAKSADRFASSQLDLPEYAPLEAELWRALDYVVRQAVQCQLLDSVDARKRSLESAVVKLVECDDKLKSQNLSVPGDLVRISKMWRSTMEKAVADVRDIAAPVQNIANPYDSGGKPIRGLNDVVFVGRLDIIRKIECHYLQGGQPPPLLLHGQRRMGKTSVLCRLPHVLGSEFIPVFFDLQQPAASEGIAPLVRKLSIEIERSLNRHIERTSGSVSADTRLRKAIAPLTAASLEKTPLTVFDEWLDEVESALPDKTRILVCLDEYERLQAGLRAGWGGSLLDTLRYRIQHHRGVLWLFTGAHTFAEMGSEWTDRFINAVRIKVGLLEHGDVVQMLTTPTEHFALTYDTGALDYFVCLTNGHPFLTQSVAFHLVRGMNESRRTRVDRADVDKAVGTALSGAADYFADLWQNIAQPRRALLCDLAGKRASVGSEADLAWLREHDFVTDDNELCVPMFGQWIRSQNQSNIP